ncbi:magnesium chelatase subunit ChlD-like protein [Melaminivora alkalimesophila]|uniref:Magnesium chelatase subunit ChlD-like protein n=2 Tax=Melaminivora alkalimesophila TaxID=1165852 RepID=A0A317RCN9_9BURK|nr:VWA domain-containing protein [Melaminivora alkalimesophila]PWW47676.1 magnesium chelatase subunit ChlD-like protein [Melaminivora alkalimesophila]
MPTLHCFVLDCSGSMLRSGQLARAKGVLAQLLQQAYLWRDPVALVNFGGRGSALVRAPGRAPLRPEALVLPLDGGGGTPLAEALARADAVLRRHRHGPRWLWLLTDGRTRETPARPRHADGLWVIDFEHARPPLGRAAALAGAWDARLVPAREL